MSVVKLKREKGQIVQGCDIYIGRRITMGGWNLKESIWANPYTVKEYGREKSLELYKQYIINNKSLYNSLPILEGKVLGCWCKPEACHGDVLLKLLKRKKNTEEMLSKLIKQNEIVKS